MIRARSVASILALSRWPFTSHPIPVYHKDESPGQKAEAVASTYTIPPSYHHRTGVSSPSLYPELRCLGG